jgi:hypothetical protein
VFTDSSTLSRFPQELLRRWSCRRSPSRLCRKVPTLPFLSKTIIHKFVQAGGRSWEQRTV